MAGLTSNYPEDQLDAVKELQRSQRYQDIMKRVQAGLALRSNTSTPDLEHCLLLDCNQLYVDIKRALFRIHSFVRNKYRPKFPELESLHLRPCDFFNVVKRIGNEMDISLVDLEGVVRSPSTAMVVSVTAFATIGKPLSEHDLVQTMEACETALELCEAKSKVEEFVKSRICYIAPNLCAVVECPVAAKLYMCCDGGGLVPLAQMLARVEAHKRRTHGNLRRIIRYLLKAPVVEKAGRFLRALVRPLVTTKAAVAAKIDATMKDPTGLSGKALLREICNKIEEWKLFPPPKLHPTKKEMQERKHKKEELKQRIHMQHLKRLNERCAKSEVEGRFTCFHYWTYTAHCTG